jgi:multidrug efflux pump subunit AcrB
MLRNIADYSIDRPVFIAVLLIIALIAGGYAYTKIPVEAVPEIVIPVVLIMTPWQGVSPSEVEEQITKPLEEGMEELDDVDSITSISSEGLSTVVVQFVAGTNLDDAIDNIQEKVNELQSEIPEEADDTVVQDLNFADIPILELGLSSDLDPQEFRDLAEDLADQIESIDGISNAFIVGAVTEEVSVSVDPLRLSALGLSFDDITNALRQENLNVPVGHLSPGEGRWLVRAQGKFDNLDTIRNLPLRASSEGILRLSDVADVSLDPEERETYSRLDGRESVGIYIQKKQGTNTVQLADEVFDLLDTWQPTFDDKGIEVVKVSDMSKFIRDRFVTMTSNARYGFLLVLAILWFFVGFRNALIVALAIPFTLILTFGLMYLFGITLSDTSTFAIIIVLGMLVDEDIIVVENTYRHMQLGKSRLEAARIGIHEVGTPILTAILTTLAAFLPLMLMSGIMGEFMKFVPMTVSFALACAFILSHTVLPVVTSYFVRVKKSDIAHAESLREMQESSNNGNKISEHYLFLPGLLRRYERLLKWTLSKSTLGSIKIPNHSILAAICWTLLLAAIGTILMMDKTLFGEYPLPQFNINVTTPEGTDLDATDRISRRLEGWLADHPDVDHYLVAVGSDTGGDTFNFLTFANPTVSNFSVQLNERDDEKNADLVDRVMDELRELSSNVAGAEIEYSDVNMGPPVGDPFFIRIQGDDMEQLHDVALYFEDVLESINEDFEADGKGRPIKQISNTYPDPVYELKVLVDRERAERLGLSTSQVAGAMHTAIAGLETSEFTILGEDRTADVIVRLPESGRQGFEDIQNLSFRSPINGSLIPFTSVADIHMSQGYSSFRRLDGQRSVRVRMDLKGVSPYEVALKLDEMVKPGDSNIPPGYSWSIGGDNEEMEESFASLGIALIVAVLLIYVILVWQFNSAFQPIAIMSSIPFAIVGIVIGLLLTNQPFGLLPFMALVALSGIVVNDAIVLITYINQLRREGMEKVEAIIRAGITRLRPIIMTSVTTSLGILPMTLGWGSSRSESGLWTSFGISMIFGLLTATLLILIVIPTVYYIVTGWEEALAPRFKRD